MAEQVSPDNLGGFKVISDMLVGGGEPQPFNPSVDDEDEKNLEGVTDFDENEDPIVTDPKIDDTSVEDPIVDPPVVDTPEDPVPPVSSGDEIDMSEYQEDITSYLKEELEEKLGWEIPEDYEMKSMDDVVSFMSELVEKSSAPKYANDDVAKFDEYVRNGGDLRTFYSETMDGKVDTNSIDIDSEFNQKIVLKEHLKNQGYSTAQIDRRLTRYEEAGVLEDEATDALEMIKEFNETNEQRLLEGQEKQAQAAVEQQQKFISSVEDSVNQLDSIRGINIPEKERKELLDYILKPDASGMTQYQKEYMSNINNLVESAYFTKNAQALVDKSRKEGKKEAYRSLQQKIKTNKGNKGKSNEGRDYSEKSTSGLSLIGKQLIG